MSFPVNVRGMFVSPSHFKDIDFGELEDRGLKQVFVGNNNIITNCDPIINNINDQLSYLESTNLKLYSHSSPFLPIQGTYPNPEDETYLKIMIQNVSRLVSETEIEGVTFDDFVYPDIYYDYSKYHLQANILKDFADAVTVGVHEADPNKTLGVCLTWANHQAGDIKTIAPSVDYVIAMVYRLIGTYQTTDDITSNHNWTREKIKIALSNAKNIIPALITYTSDITHVSYSSSNIYEDVHVALKLCRSYILFNYSYAPLDISFPCFQRVSVSNRVVVNNRRLRGV